jgi:hypothetical protein
MSNQKFPILLAIVSTMILTTLFPRMAVADDDPQKVSAIFNAARNGNLDTLKQLIGNGRVDVKMADGATPLFDAAMRGQSEVLKWLLEKGANVNCALPDGTTALHLAVVQKQEEACRILLAKKANVNAVITKNNGFHLTPLSLAIDRKAKSIVLLLIDSGADLNTPLGRGYVPDYPLEAAAWPEPDGWPGQNDVIKALVAKGAKSPWLSRIKEFNPSNLNALTPEKNQKGDVMVGSMPLVVGTAPARRNGALPPGNSMKQDLRVVDSQTGKDFWRWGDPQKDTGPLTVAMIVDGKGNKTELQIVPTIYIGDDGVAFSENISDVEKNGPFVDVIVDASENIVKVTATRSNGKIVELTRSGRSFRVTLDSVTDYEPISVTTFGNGDSKQSSSEFGCVYRSAKSGTVIYHVQ